MPTMKKLFKKPKLDLEIDQVPTLVNNSHTDQDDLMMLKATAVVYSSDPLSQKELLITFSGERVTPVPTPLFSISPSEQTKRMILRENQRVELSEGKQHSNVYRYEAPVEFEIPKGLPGTISPLTTGSSSIRYYLNASFHASIFSGASTCCKEIHIFRACRDDVSSLDTFVDNVGCFEECVNYEIWSMKSVLCGGKARFHITLNAVKPDITIESIRVVLKERQVVQVPVPAMHQSRPGEMTTMAATFDLAERTVDVPQTSSRKSVDKYSNSYNVLFDLSLPETTKGYRRSSATRGGIKFEHYFNIEIAVSNAGSSIGPIRLRSDTKMALPIDFEHYVPNLEATDPCQKRLLVAPPAYDEFAPPGYGPHKIDQLYEGGQTVVKSVTNQEVIFL